MRKHNHAGPAQRWGALPLALSIVLLSGCMLGPDYVRPDLDLPAQHRAPATLDVAQADSLADIAWFDLFDDPELSALLREAVAQNLDLQQALARVDEARARTGYQRSFLWPTVQGQLGTTPSPGLPGGNDSSYSLGLGLNWELDFFGGVRRAIESADALLDSEEEGRKDVLVTLLGEVARTYIELRSNQQMLAVTRDNLQSQEETLRLTRLRRDAGLSSELEVAQSEGLTAETRSQAPVYETAVKQAIHALGVLLGQPPGKLAPRLEPEAPVPVSADPGLADPPANLVQRRPDIRKAERRLAATNADIGVATAELYPKVNLTTFLGIQNTNIAQFTPVGKSWSMAASLSTPIFNWGRIQANIKAKNALNEQAFLNYQATVLNAYQEVENALVAHAEEGQRIAALRQGMEAQQLALSLSNERWRRGLAAYLDVLLAERSLFQVQREWVESQAKQSAQLVALYKALGGGWQAGGPAEKSDVDWAMKPADYLLEKLHAK